MSLAAVLFDLDGTLHDKTATLRKMAVLQYEHVSAAGIPLDTWTERFVALNNERIEKPEVFERLAVEFNLAEKLRSRLLHGFDERLGSIAQPMDGAVEILEWCRAMGLKTAIVTNGRDAFQRSKVSGMGIDSLVDHVVTSGGLGIKKPSHAIFMSCLEGLAVAPRNAAMVGDDVMADIAPAKELGMLAIYVGRSNCAQADFVAEGLRAVKGYLQGVA